MINAECFIVVLQFSYKIVSLSFGFVLVFKSNNAAYTAEQHLVNFRVFSPCVLNLLFAFLCIICKLMMIKTKRLSNTLFYDNFGYFIFSKTISEFQFLCTSVGYV